MSAHEVPLTVPEAARHLLLALMHEHVSACGGWQAEQEYAIWEECENQDGASWSYGIGASACDTLREISGMAEGWYAWSADFGAPIFVPTGQWERMFRLWLKRIMPERERANRAMDDEIATWMQPGETPEHYAMRQAALCGKVVPS